MTKDKSLDVNLAHERSGRTLGPLAQNRDNETPFEVYAFENLLEDKLFDQLRLDINSNVKLSVKHNDLYKFKQSQDLRSEIHPDKLTPLLRSFSDVMLDSIRPRLEELSSFNLSSEKFDITASRYDPGDYLLCHNDDMKDPTKKQARALAFIFYLNTRPWSSDDGGALILYDSDKAGEPVAINNHIHPKPNTLVVFKTSFSSWHSVQEVYCQDDTRLSVNGWFHHGDLTRLEPPAIPTIEPNPFVFVRPVPLDERLEKFFNESISSEYLMPRTCFMIKRQFKRKSEINLSNFLKPEKYQEISKALREATSSSANLEQVGPYNKRCYQRLKVNKLPQICQDLYDAFRSELFFMLVSRFTGLDLQPSHLRDEKQESESSDDEASDPDEDDDDEGEGEEDDPDEDDQDDEDEEDEDESPSQEDESSESESQEAKAGASEAQPADGSAATSVVEKGKEDTREKQERLPADPLARLEFRNFDAGAYTLIHDYAFELHEQSALDVMLHFNHDFEVNFEHGGYISYVDVSCEEEEGETGPEEDLLTVEPKSNSLSLVYRSDESTCRFLKYITRAHESSYQDLSCVYYERLENLPNKGAGVELSSGPSKADDDDERETEKVIKKVKTDEA